MRVPGIDGSLPEGTGTTVSSCQLLVVLCTPEAGRGLEEDATDLLIGALQVGGHLRGKEVYSGVNDGLPWCDVCTSDRMTCSVARLCVSSPP